MARDEEGLCEKCFYRHDSRRRVEEYVQMKLARGETPPFKGPVNDLSPRFECKLHEGYDRPVETKIQCGDFRPA